MNVVIYARYSSHSQTEQSIEGQLTICEDFAKRNNYHVISKYIDRALTGTNDNRPQFKQMIEDSKKGIFQGVLVYQLDRFARNRYDSATYKNKLKKNGVRVFSAKENISEDASGILMESVLEGMAEYYSAELSQKVKRGMDINAKKCLYNGGVVPLGFKIDQNKKYQLDNNMVPIVQKIFRMYRDGYTMKDLITYLNENNIKNYLEKEFKKNSIRNLLTNKKYIGSYIYNNKEVKNAIPRIIDNETFYKVQARIEINKKAPARGKAKTEYLLTTKLFCGKCKEMMVGVSGTSKTGKIHNYYSCNGTRKKLCNKKNVQKNYIEEIVVKYAREILTKENIEKISKGVYDLVEKERNDTNISSLENKIKEFDKQISNLLYSLKLCELDSVRKTIFEEINKLETEKNCIVDQVSIEKAKQLPLTREYIKFFLTNIRKGSIEDIRYKKVLINVLINRIYLYDNNLIIICNIQDKNNEIHVPLEEIESSFLGKDGTPLQHFLYIMPIYKIL